MTNKNLYFYVFQELDKTKPSDEVLNSLINGSGKDEVWAEIITKYLLGLKTTEIVIETEQGGWEDLKFENIYKHLGDDKFNDILFDILIREKDFVTQRFIISFWIEKWRYVYTLSDQVIDLCREGIKEFMNKIGKFIPEIVEAYIDNNISLFSMSQIKYTDFNTSDDIINTLNYIFNKQIEFNHDSLNKNAESIYNFMALVYPSERLMEQLTGGVPYEKMLKGAIEYFFQLEGYDKTRILKLRGYEKMRNELYDNIYNNYMLEHVMHVIDKELVYKAC